MQRSDQGSDSESIRGNGCEKEVGLHQPVLLQEVLMALAIKPAGRYVDATFGRGGHSRAILQQLNERGRLLVIDQDPEAIIVAQQLANQDPRMSIVQGTFANLKKWVEELAWQGKVDGILMDLGVSSPQLDEAGRGFSFLQEGPLDMRMNPGQTLDAAKWVNATSEKEMAHVFFSYGEERFARRIARAIVAARAEQPITTTLKLAEIIKKAHPAWQPGQHPATRCFQAIRIAVNDELGALQQGLQQSEEILAPQGRLCVISFHSLEDRIVKNFMKGKTHTAEMEQAMSIPFKLSGAFDALLAKQRVNLRTVDGLQRPSAEEVRRNPRSRSARLRVAEKCT